MESNKRYDPGCALSKVQQLIGGKWKLMLLWYISEEPRRFGEIHRTFPDITQAMLTKQLRELENDGLVHREVYKEVPPRVEYSLTDLGKLFVPILRHMYDWGEEHLKE
ncbi:helix-turn-helix domain-containing protein [Paenibacillus sp. ACRRY]|uniref:winged helix-turn-helix transcriptional regulator n=1 Tax=Paenibacillus sp. ACRRY TaxID=2918208 RepID=UPI001EF4CF05|nr:helix-turn-helix domain-containing protein [Paenibacillus sp. ACRRY]MCG7384503.1 helix-turn-helix transcriptional regulator [Paenibacillus sp. ACRRY]